MNGKTITLIGGGNMGQTIARALIQTKQFKTHSVRISTPRTSHLSKDIKKTVQIYTSNAEACKDTHIIMLCIKPQIAKQVLAEIKPHLKNQLVVSIMAGISLSTLAKNIPERVSIIRCMPNLCAAVHESMTVWVRNKHVSEEQIKIIKKVFRTFGKETELLHESDINSVTALSGSGPAYFFYLVQILEEVGKEMSLPSNIVKTIIQQTLFGTAKMLQTTELSPEILRKQVTSKGGTTEAAFHILYQKNIARIIKEAVCAARLRAQQLSQ